MAKIGILSMQRIKNYGSFLQAYGLKKILEKQGHDVEFVDYHIESPIIKENNETTLKKNDKLQKALTALSGDEPLTQKIKYILHKKNFGKKYYKILDLTDEPNYNPELDTLVIGSDEVFNCIQSNQNVGYSLELFGKNNKARNLISYAASFGNTTLEKIEKYSKEKELGDLLSKFNSISVRDNNSGKIVENISNKKVEYHLDPVLAYDYMNECDLIPKVPNKEKYILVYAYSGRISLDEAQVIRKYAKEKKLKVYSIGGAQKCADKFIDCSPFEVLAYFKNAQLIITDTFHGSIFSIITHSDFVTLVRKSIGNAYGNEEKLTDLLDRLNLNNRIIYNLNELSNKLEQKIDYAITDKILEEEREKTYKYLKRAIKHDLKGNEI